MFYINITIGREDYNTIVIPSPSVSAAHAQITLYEDGRILYEDQSTNGSLINNKKIQGTSEFIKMNDTILLPGNNVLPWGKVPSIPNAIKEAKKMYHIGRADDNDIILNDNRVGRRHATIFMDKDNNFFIVDLSRHGTTVNGSKVPAYKPKPLKYGDKVVFSNSTELDWKNIAKPPIKMKFVAMAFVALALLMAAKPTYDYFTNINKCTFDNFKENHKDQTVYVLQQSYGKVMINGEFVGYFGGEGDPRIKNFRATKEGLKPISFHGTGFGVIGEGRFATNYHVAQNLDNQAFVQLLVDFAKVNPFFKSLVDYLTLAARSGARIEIIGEVHKVFIVRNGQTISYEESSDPHLERFSEKFLEVEVVNPGSKERDIAIVQLKDKTKSNWFQYYKYEDFSVEKPKSGEEVKYLGYPWETVQADKQGVKNIEAGEFQGHVNNVRPDGDIQIDANVQGGASGSPALNKCGKIIGYVTYGWGEGETTNFCKPAKHLLELLAPYKPK